MRVYSLKLVPYSSDATHFIIWPCFNYQSGQRVFQHDKFYFAYRDIQLLKKHFFVFFDEKPKAKTLVGKKQGISYYNTYLYEEVFSCVQFEQEQTSTKHLLRELNDKAIWITHVVANYYLALEKANNAPDHSNSVLSDIIADEGDAKSQSFVLTFKKYDDITKIPTDGLWVLRMDKKDNSIVDLKHMQYGIFNTLFLI